MYNIRFSRLSNALRVDAADLPPRQMNKELHRTQRELDKN